MIYGINYRSRPGFLEEYKTSTAETMGASFMESVSENPFTKILSYVEKETAGGPMVSRQQAEELAKARNVVVNNIPEEGLNEGALNVLIDRQYQKKLRQDVINRGTGGFTQSAGNLLASFTGGLVDPLNIAASFIPVVGQARYARMLAGATGALGRTGIRAGVGAVEGVVGATLMEPANYMLAQELGDDYDIADSMVNIAMGGPMGAVFHSGFGAIGDAMDGVFKASGPEWAGVKAAMGKIPLEVAAHSPESRLAYMKTAISQLSQDQKVEVKALREAQDLDLKTRLQWAETKLERALAAGDKVQADYFAAVKSDVLEEMGEVAAKADAPAEAPKVIDSATLKAEHTAPDGTLDAPSAAKTLQSEVKRILAAEGVARITVDGETRSISAVSEAGFTDDTGRTWSVQDVVEKGNVELVPRTAAATAAGASPAAVPYGLADLGRAHDSYKEMVSAPPSSRFIKPELTRELEVELAEARKLKGGLEEATELADDEMALLKQEAKQMGLDPEDFLEDPDAEIKLVNEREKMLVSLANCVTRKG